MWSGRNSIGRLRTPSRAHNDRFVSAACSDSAAPFRDSIRCSENCSSTLGIGAAAVVRLLLARRLSSSRKSRRIWLRLAQVPFYLSTDLNPATVYRRIDWIPGKVSRGRKPLQRLRNADVMGFSAVASELAIGAAYFSAEAARRCSSVMAKRHPRPRLPRSVSGDSRTAMSSLNTVPSLRTTLKPSGVLKLPNEVGQRHRLARRAPLCCAAAASARRDPSGSPCPACSIGVSYTSCKLRRRASGMAGSSMSRLSASRCGWVGLPSR